MKNIIAASIFATILLIWVNFKTTESENIFNDVEVVSIYDGDTFFVNLRDTNDLFGKRIGIRLKDIDCLEIRGGTEETKELARKAKMFTVEKLRSAKRIDLKNLERGKYFRIIAEVFVDGKSLNQMLLEEELAVKYESK